MVRRVQHTITLVRLRLKGVQRTRLRGIPPNENQRTPTSTPIHHDLRTRRTPHPALTHIAKQHHQATPRHMPSASIDPIREMLAVLTVRSSPSTYGSSQYSPQYSQNPSIYLPHPSTTYSNPGYPTPPGYSTPPSHYTVPVASPGDREAKADQSDGKVFTCYNPTHGNGSCAGGKTFTTYSNLLRHNREQEGRAPKVYCDRCGRDFTRKTAMQQHLAHDKCRKRSSGGHTEGEARGNTVTSSW